VDRVTFHRLAERELNDAAKYYEIECPRLGSPTRPAPDRERSADDEGSWRG